MSVSNKWIRELSFAILNIAGPYKALEIANHLKGLAASERRDSSFEVANEQLIESIAPLADAAIKCFAIHKEEIECNQNKSSSVKSTKSN